MTIGRDKLLEYEKKVHRAKQLAASHKFAEEPLTFYGSVLQFQKELFITLDKNWGDEPVSPDDGKLRSELNLMAILPSYPSFLATVESSAPRPLAMAANQMARDGSPSWTALLTEHWANGGMANEDEQSGNSREPFQEFLAQAFLQPYAEFVGGHLTAAVAESASYLCPMCSSLPLVGVLRPEGDGGKRFLRCAFCAHEWSFRRILCPACGEEREEKLPVFIAEQFPHVRVESC